MKIKKKWLGILAPAFLSILFCLISVVALISMIHMQGNARVVNYTGIVRGATQRLVKQELYGYDNKELVDYLDSLLVELSTGDGENQLTRLPDEVFQSTVAQMQEAWTNIKEEIRNVRQDGDKQRLFELSEEYFNLADQAVSAAERYSEQSVNDSIGILIWLNVGFIVLGILYWAARRRQSKVQGALERAESANHAKSEFFSRMSHEIRTPMNGIIGMTAIAKKSTQDSEKVTDCLEKIELSASYLMMLLNDVLDMSRIESGKMELEFQAFELKEMFEQISVMFRGKAEESGVKLVIKYDSVSAAQIVGDKLRLSQVLVNLVSNAIKFTPAGGTVTLEAGQKNMTDTQVELEFTVTDTGIGISEAFQARIFEPFEQEEKYTARQYGGTGLGLSISSSFVNMMGGQISVESRLGEGTKFTVNLAFPRVIEDEQQRIGEYNCNKSEREEEQHELSGVRILLAEDNEINAEIVTELLQESKAAVEQACNGEIAVEKFAESPEGTYTMILMDIQMPVMDGMEAARAIRALNRPDAEKVLIIGLSANAFREDVDKAMDSGMNGYLCKPIDPERLYQILEGFLRDRALQA